MLRRALRDAPTHTTNSADTPLPCTHIMLCVLVVHGGSRLHTNPKQMQASFARPKASITQLCIMRKAINTVRQTAGVEAPRP